MSTYSCNTVFLYLPCTQCQCCQYTLQQFYLKTNICVPFTIVIYKTWICWVVFTILFTDIFVLKILNSSSTVLCTVQSDRKYAFKVRRVSIRQKRDGGSVSSWLRRTGQGEGRTRVGCKRRGWEKVLGTCFQITCKAFVPTFELFCFLTISIYHYNI